MADAFKYPFSNLKRFIMLGLIFLVMEVILHVSEVFADLEYGLSLLIIYYAILLIIEGYLLRVMGNSIKGSDELPKFDDWPRLFIDGIKVFLTLFAYLFIPSIILVIGYVLLLRYALADVGVIILLIGIFLAVLFVLLVNMAFANMAYHEKLSAALEIREIYHRIKIIGVMRYIFLSIIIMVIVVVGTLITIFMIDLIPIFGLIVSFLISTYLELFMYRAFAMIYKETLEPEF